MKEKETELNRLVVLRDKLIAQKELYSCPSCEAKLRLLNNDLHLVKGESGESGNTESVEEIEENIVEIRANVKKLQRLSLTSIEIS